MWYVFWALSMAFIVGVVVVYAVWREHKEEDGQASLYKVPSQSASPALRILELLSARNLLKKHLKKNHKTQAHEDTSSQSQAPISLHLNAEPDNHEKESQSAPQSPPKKKKGRPPKTT
ncbi:MAG: hypothetical protein V6Z78_03040 [Holosporaceae bacterium]